jgi:hypothetical protein
MASIKFSHIYKKLIGTDGQVIKSAKLLLALPVQMESISRAKDFIDYDTDNGKYTLSFQTFYLLLVFQKPSGDLFTTCRPLYGSSGKKPKGSFHPPIVSKQKYYEGLIGHQFEVVITSSDMDKEVLHVSTSEKAPDLMAPDYREESEKMDYYQRHLK